ncbi:hypothetical protein J2Z69_000762 [Paenibacillus shirakamiensis]|uniref:Uncharacterized protein n=1 Tax=Paenibacillus shirakamiensis TaxID=1265935 RepID=A0ABS4JDE6_9BACL|nr:hypothetical protein [Paenibacillus shirakamiensis]MBP1999743.1 hypothetical protein [Paenibacillus shirakamiensis]
MKRLITLLLSICMLVSVPIAAVAAEGNEKASPVLNERVVSILKENNVEFQIVNGNIKLVETSPQAVAKANGLISQQDQYSTRATSYPGPWVHEKLNDIYNSRKFQAATKTALAAAVIEWAKNMGIPDPVKISVAAAGGFAAYYFINTDKEDLYFLIKYYYREIGKGFFTENGTFIGDYEIKKEIRVTKNSNYTGGNVENDIRKSTIVDPWF